MTRLSIALSLCLAACGGTSFSSPAAELETGGTGGALAMPSGGLVVAPETGGSAEAGAAGQPGATGGTGGAGLLAELAELEREALVVVRVMN